MLKDNLIMLRKMNGYSQEQIAEKIDHPVELIRHAISRNSDKIFCVERGLFLLAEQISIEQ